MRDVEPRRYLTGREEFGLSSGPGIGQGTPLREARLKVSSNRFAKACGKALGFMRHQKLRAAPVSGPLASP